LAGRQSEADAHLYSSDENRGRARLSWIAFPPGRLLKNSYQCHPEIAPVLRERRIRFASNGRTQQILRSSTPATAKAAVAGDPGFHPNKPTAGLSGTPAAQDDTLGEQFFAACWPTA